MSDLVKRDPILDQFSIITKPYARLNGLKTIPFPWTHTHIAKIWEYPPPWAVDRLVENICVVASDWVAKCLPQKCIESQSDWFGKRVDFREVFRAIFPAMWSNRRCVRMKSPHRDPKLSLDFICIPVTTLSMTRNLFFKQNQIPLEF